MAEGNKGGRGLRVLELLFAVAAICTILGTWYQFTHQDQSIGPFKQIVDSLNQIKALIHPDATVSSPPAAASAPSALPDTFTSLSLTSTDVGIRMSRAQFARIINSSNVAIEIRATASNPVKVFVMTTAASGFAHPDGWSVSTDNGNVCYVDANLNGLHVFRSTDFQSHTDEMQQLGPDSVQTSTVTANCAGPALTPSDKFILSTQLYTLPADVVQDSTNARHPGTADFSGDGIPSE
jgi:hypothetical protein